MLQKRGQTLQGIDDSMKEDMRYAADYGFNKIQLDEFREQFKKYDVSKLGLISQSDVIEIIRGLSCELLNPNLIAVRIELTESRRRKLIEMMEQRTIYKIDFPILIELASTAKKMEEGVHEQDVDSDYGTPLVSQG
eukprot:TRINITY_DN863_c0_g1_i4.p1 TRINITY_DN863_c0_g1~~TRINITY_DN863_c0_g1_i4.p1  ORF type:complete len:136 (+),score=24.53 TRINITY_DN863_c0_g1_i4:171-578(+)